MTVYKEIRKNVISKIAMNDNEPARQMSNLIYTVTQKIVGFNQKIPNDWKKYSIVGDFELLLFIRLFEVFVLLIASVVGFALSEEASTFDSAIVTAEAVVVVGSVEVVVVAVVTVTSVEVPAVVVVGNFIFW